MKTILCIAAFLVAFMYKLDAAANEQRDVVSIIRASAIHHGIDPKLAVAIAKVESGLNPKAVGKIGEIGLFQLRPEYHNVKFGDIQNNVDVAMKYLVDLKKKCEPKYKDAWIICFNLGPYYSKPIRHPKKFPYYVKVQKKILIASN